MNYCKTGLNKFGLMAVAGTVKDVTNDNKVILEVSEHLRKPDGKWGDVSRTITCDVSQTGGTNGIEKGQDFCAIGYGRPEGDNMKMDAKAAGTGDCRIEVQEVGTARTRQGNTWIENEKPFVFGMVMGDATYQVDQTKNGNDRIRAQFHIEEMYDKMGSPVIVSDKATQIFRSDDKSQARKDRFVKHLEDACEKAGITPVSGAEHNFDRVPFKSVFLFREDAEKYRNNQYAQIQEFSPSEGRNAGTVYYYRSEFMYQPDFVNFGTPDMAAVKAREEEERAYNDRDAAREEKVPDPTREEGAVYSDPFQQNGQDMKTLEDDNPFSGMDYSDTL